MSTRDRMASAVEASGLQHGAEMAFRAALRSDRRPRDPPRATSASRSVGTASVGTSVSGTVQVLGARRVFHGLQALVGKRVAFDNHAATRFHHQPSLNDVAEIQQALPWVVKSGTIGKVLDETSMSPMPASALPASRGRPQSAPRTRPTLDGRVTPDRRSQTPKRLGSSGRGRKPLSNPPRLFRAAGSHARLLLTLATERVKHPEEAWDHFLLNWAAREYGDSSTRATIRIEHLASSMRHSATVWPLAAILHSWLGGSQATPYSSTTHASRMVAGCCIDALRIMLDLVGQKPTRSALQQLLFATPPTTTVDAYDSGRFPVALVSALLRRLLRESPAFNMSHLHVVCASLGVDYHGWSHKGRETLISAASELICHGRPGSLPSGVDSAIDEIDFEHVFCCQPSPSVRVDWLLLIIVRTLLREHSRLVEALQVVHVAAEDDSIDEIARECAECLNTAMADIDWADADRSRVLNQVEVAALAADQQCKAQHGASRLAREAAVVAHRETLKGVVELWLDATAKGEAATEEALAGLSATAGRLEASKAELEKQANQLSSTLGDLQEARFQLEVLQREHDRLVSERTELGASLSKTATSYQHAALQVAELEARLSSAETDLRRTRRAAAAAEGDAEAVRARAAVQAAQASKAAGEAAAARSEAAKATRDREAMAAGASRAQEAAAGAHKGAATARARSFVFGARLQVAQAKAAAARSQSGSTADELLLARQEALEHKAAAAAAATRLDALTQESDALRGSLAEAGEANAQLRRDAAEARITAAAATTKATLVEEQNASLRERLKRLEEALHGAQAEADALHAAASVSEARQGDSVASSSGYHGILSFGCPNAATVPPSAELLPPLAARPAESRVEATRAQTEIADSQQTDPAPGARRPPGTRQLPAGSGPQTRRHELLATRLRAAVSLQMGFGSRRRTPAETPGASTPAAQDPGKHAPGTPRAALLAANPLQATPGQSASATMQSPTERDEDGAAAQSNPGLGLIEAPPTSGGRAVVRLDGGEAVRPQHDGGVPTRAVASGALLMRDNDDDKFEGPASPPEAGDGAVERASQSPELSVADSLLAELARADKAH